MANLKREKLGKVNSEKDISGKVSFDKKYSENVIHGKDGCGNG